MGYIELILIAVAIAVMIAGLVRVDWRPYLSAIATLLGIVPVWILTVVLPLLHFGPRGATEVGASWDPPADWVWLVIMATPIVMVLLVVFWQKTIINALNTSTWPWLAIIGLYALLLGILYLTN